MSLQTRNRAVSLPRFEAPPYERKEKMTQEDRLSLSFSGADQLDGFRELSERILITPGNERLFWFDLCAAAMSDHGQFKPQRIIRSHGGGKRKSNLAISSKQA